MGSSSSTSNSSSSSSASTSAINVERTSARAPCNGGYWQNQVAFDPRADQPFDASNVIRINNDSLINEMESLIDTSENIKSIGVYKCPLNEGQLVQLLDCHQFVVLGTANWWYSIEKNSVFICIRRSKSIESVRCYFTDQRRKTDIKQISLDDGRDTMKDLIQFLYTNNELNKRYDSVSSNCHAFAKRIFDKFAAKKVHEIVWGCSETKVIKPPWQEA